jgi:hypothetical protein
LRAPHHQFGFPLFKQPLPLLRRHTGARGYPVNRKLSIPSLRLLSTPVMAGLDPAIHVFVC